jgi:AFG3 family protein
MLVRRLVPRRSVSTLLRPLPTRALSLPSPFVSSFYATEAKRRRVGRLSKDADAKKDSKEKEKLKEKEEKEPAEDDDLNKLPPGLEDFFGHMSGRNRPPPPPPESEQSSSNKEKEDREPASQFPGPQGSPPTSVSTILLVGLLAYALYQVSSDSSEREITWQEFRTAFLDKGLVDRLEVVNRSKVRVHLHSNATGAVYPQSPAAEGKARYVFSIGSVEAFERKLDDAQKELGIPSSERVPVAYRDEVSILSTLVSFAPTLLLVGFLIWMTRRAAGGGMGGGSGGGIFGIGKSKAKLFNVGGLSFLASLSCQSDSRMLYSKRQTSRSSFAT